MLGRSAAFVSALAVVGERARRAASASVRRGIGASPARAGKEIVREAAPRSNGTPRSLGGLGIAARAGAEERRPPPRRRPLLALGGVGALEGGAQRLEVDEDGEGLVLFPGHQPAQLAQRVGAG